VFPQFGPGKLQQHGFARISKWKHASVGESAVCFTLTHDMIPESFKDLWPFEFMLTYTVELLPTGLKMEFKVQNTGSIAFPFTCLLHTYFSVDDVSNASVEKLQNAVFTDSLVDKTKQKESRALVTIEKEVDRIYENISNELIVNKNVKLELGGFTDAVVWNPWIEKSKKMADFDDEEYKKMICVEVGVVSHELVLEPAKEWVGYQVLSDHLTCSL
jgi:glucose-6-phosphate 1-epimerase